MGTLKNVINLHTLVKVKTGLIYRYICMYFKFGAKKQKSPNEGEEAKVHPNIAILDTS